MNMLSITIVSIMVLIVYVSMELVAFLILTKSPYLKKRLAAVIRNFLNVESADSVNSKNLDLSDDYYDLKIRVQILEVNLEEAGNNLNELKSKLKSQDQVIDDMLSAIKTLEQDYKGKEYGFGVLAQAIDNLHGTVNQYFAKKKIK